MIVRDLPIVIIGAGPVGLVAAAHVLCRGGNPLILEAGSRAGWNVRQWSHIALFSPWKWVTDPLSRSLLARAGVSLPDSESIPTGREFVHEFIEPLAERTALARHLRVGRRVVNVSRSGGSTSAPFEVTAATPDGVETHLARAVVDASGTWTNVNPLGARGEYVPGERENVTRISYGLPDVKAARERFSGRQVVIAGSGHSAANLLIDLAAIGRDASAGSILWVVRRHEDDLLYGHGDADRLPARANLGRQVHALVHAGVVKLIRGFTTARVSESRGQLSLHATSGDSTGPADEVIVATGFRPDYSFGPELQLALDPALECPAALAPHIDPKVHPVVDYLHGYDELKQPERGFFIIGVKSFGRATGFDLVMGYEQARSVAAGLLGDFEAARRIGSWREQQSHNRQPLACKIL